MSSVSVVHKSRHFSLVSWVCDASHDGPSDLEYADRHELVFVRKGAFAIARGREELLATPNEALLLGPGVDYRVRHPIGGGDSCTIVAISREFADSLGPRGVEPRSARSLAVAPSQFREQSSLLAATTNGHASTLETEERISALVRSTAAADGSPVDAEVPAPTARRRVAAARELIAAHFREPLPLATIGDSVGLSPFHLSRAFRRLTGTSMHRYQTQLRVRAAMARLTEGEDDLTGLALDLGFSSHSHFTAAFAQQFGLPPARFRSAQRRRGHSPARAPHT